MSARLLIARAVAAVAGSHPVPDDTGETRIEVASPWRAWAQLIVAMVGQFLILQDLGESAEFFRNIQDFARVPPWFAAWAGFLLWWLAGGAAARVWRRVLAVGMIAVAVAMIGSLLQLRIHAGVGMIVLAVAAGIGLRDWRQQLRLATAESARMSGEPVARTGALACVVALSLIALAMHGLDGRLPFDLPAMSGIAIAVLATLLCIAGYALLAGIAARLAAAVLRRAVEPHLAFVLVMTLAPAVFYAALSIKLLGTLAGWRFQTLGLVCSPLVLAALLPVAGELLLAIAARRSFRGAGAVVGGLVVAGLILAASYAIPELSWGPAMVILYVSLAIYPTMCLFARCSATPGQVVAGTVTLVALALVLLVFGAIGIARGQGWDAVRREPLTSVIARVGIRVFPVRHGPVADLRKRLVALPEYPLASQVEARSSTIPPGSATAPPIIVLIVADALRASSWNDAVVGGGRERMREDGTLFTHAIATHNATSGSLPVICTGILMPHLGSGDANQAGLTINRIIDAVEGRGYETVAYLPYESNLFRLWRSREFIVPTAGRGRGDPEALLPLALERIRAARQAARPIFVYVHAFNIHVPLLRRAIPPGLEPVHAALRPTVRTYFQNVVHFDQALGRFIDALKQDGLWERSLVMVTADHGEEKGEYGGNDHGWQVNPEIVHVPLAVKLPREPEDPLPTGTCDAVVTLADLHPTILAQLGGRLVPSPGYEAVVGSDLRLAMRGTRAAHDVLCFNWKGTEIGLVEADGSRLQTLDLWGGDVLSYPLSGPLREAHGHLVPDESGRREIIDRFAAAVEVLTRGFVPPSADLPQHQPTPAGGR